MTQAQIARELGIYRTTSAACLNEAAIRELSPSPSTILQRKSLAGAATEAKVWPERLVVVSGNDEDEETQLAMMGLTARNCWIACWSLAILSVFPGSRGERTG